MFGYAEAAAHWRRAIELADAAAGERPAAEPGQSAADPDVPGWYLRAIDARHLAGDAEGAGVLAEEAYRRFADHPDPAVAAVVRERAARFRGIGDVFLGGQATPGSGIPLITEALALFDQAPPSAEHAEALFYYGHYLFSGEGRHEEGIRAIRRGQAIAEAAGAAALIPRMQPLLAYHLFLGGQLEMGFAALRRAARSPNPAAMARPASCSTCTKARPCSRRAESPPPPRSRRAVWRTPAMLVSRGSGPPRSWRSPGQAIFCGPLLTAGMRACADLAERARARQDDRAENAALAAGADLADLAGQLPADPFAEHPFAATVPAEHASWEAERARLAGLGDPAERAGLLDGTRE